MMTESYPRVLILSPDNLGDHSATAITLNNLFQGWPANSLSIIYGNISPSNSKIYQKSWHLSLNDVPFDRFFRALLGGFKERIFGKTATGIPGGIKISNDTEKLINRSFIYEVAHSWASLFPFKPKPSFWNWVKDFQPDIIYSVLGSNRYMDIVIKLSKFCNVPIVPHFMDDWPKTYYPGIFNFIPRTLMNLRLQQIIKRSPFGLTICDYMSIEFTKRYGIPFKAFMNCIKVPDELPLLKNKQNSKLQLVYIGGLHLNRWKSLLSFDTILSTLREENLLAELTIHAPLQDVKEYSCHFADCKTVKIGKTLSQKEVQEVLLSSDILVYVESFDPAVKEYTRLSLSTKIPQYMASGRPILYYGPKEIASYKYLNDNQCGQLVGTKNMDKLLIELKELILKKSLRVQLSKCAWEIAKKSHDSEVVRQNFHLTLASIK